MGRKLPRATDSSPEAIKADPVAIQEYSKTYLRMTIFLLAASYASNYSDRIILSILAQPIKVDLNISDAQLGFLSGTALAVFYAIFGYPLAKLSGVRGRVNVIAGCMFLWSGMTVLCGFAGNFMQLVIYRFGVGIGEAGLAPPAHSLISDHYPPKRRASAMSMFNAGIPIGSLIGFVGGGIMAKEYGWRAAFIVAGLPGLVLAPLIKLLIKEPPRGNWDPPSKEKAASTPPPLIAVLKKQFSTRTFRHFCAGLVILLAFGSGPGTFGGAYYVRRFHIDYATLGAVLGLLSGIAGLFGFAGGGLIADWLSKWGKRWYALFPAIAVLIGAPFSLMGYLQNDWKHQVLFMLVPGVLAFLPYAPFYATTQNLMPSAMRASAAAVVFFLINLIGLGFGPPIYGHIIDILTQTNFAKSGFGDYGAVCGLGTLKTTAPNVAQACQLAIAESTRWTLAIGSVTGALWASIHFFIASTSIAKDLADAERAR